MHCHWSVSNNKTNFLKFTVFTFERHMQDKAFLKDLLDTQGENICIGHLTKRLTL